MLLLQFSDKCTKFSLQLSLALSDMFLLSVNIKIFLVHFTDRIACGIHTLSIDVDHEGVGSGSLKPVANLAPNDSTFADWQVQVK